MTLLETISLLNMAAASNPNINGIVESGDIYDLSKDEFQQKYSAFCVTQGIHTIGEQFSTYRFTLFYVDRLTLDKSNKIQIHSTAMEFFQNLVTTLVMLSSEYKCDFEYGDVHTFTERFSAECAGAYMDCYVTTTNTSLCPIWYEEPEPPTPTYEKGAFDADAWSDGFFKWVII